MALYLFKLIPLFVYPPGLLIVLSVLGLFLAGLGRVRWATACVATGICVFWLAATPVVASKLLAKLEHQFPAVSARNAPQRDCLVVLGGVTRQPDAGRLEPDWGDAVDRVLTASRLYKAGKAKSIIVAAGNLPWLDAATPEAEFIRDLLVEWQVPESAIRLDRNSRNTRENALNAAALMKEAGCREALLVTSAAHMPRAVAVFRALGWRMFPVPTDFRADVSGPATLFDWLPDVDALMLTTAALREWLGIWAYRWRGWA